MSITQHFPIEGMTCGNCVRHVEQALNNLSGISQFEVNLEKHEALIEYDPTLTTYEDMASALKDAGYNIQRPIE